METKTLLDISNNEASQKVSAEEAANVYNNRDKLSMPASAYMGNYQLYQAEMNKLNMDSIGEYQGLAKSLANGNMFTVIKKEREELRKKEELLAQKKFDESSIWNRLATSYKTSSISMDKAKAQDELLSARESGDFNKVRQLSRQIDDYNKELSQYRTETDPGLISVLGSLGASTVEFAPELIGGVLLSMASDALTVGTGGAAAAGSVATKVKLASTLGKIGKVLSPYIQGAFVLNKTADIETGSAYEELGNTYPDLDEAKRVELSRSIGRVSGFVEAAGFTFGLGGLTKSALTKVISKNLINKTVTPATLGSEVFKKSLARKLTEATVKLSGGIASEASEEVLQSAIVDAAKEAVETGADAGMVDLAAGGFSNVGAALADVWKSVTTGKELDARTSEYLSTFFNTMGASAILGGGIMGSAHMLGKFTAPRGVKKTNADRVAEGMKQEELADAYMKMKSESKLNQLSKDAYLQNTKDIIDAGNAPEAVIVDVDAMVEVLNEAAENPELSAALSQLNIEERIAQAQEGDGKIEIPFEEADKIIFDTENDVLYQRIKSDISFSKDAMSRRETSQYVKDLLDQNPGYKEALKNNDDPITEFVEQLKENMSDEEAIANGLLLQRGLATMGTFSNYPLNMTEFLKEFPLKIVADKKKRESKRVDSMFKAKKNWLRQNKLQGYKVRNAEVRGSDVASEDLYEGTDVSYRKALGQNIVLWENKDGALIPVAGAQTIATDKLSGLDNIYNATIISAKDGYTSADAENLSEKIYAQNAREVGIKELAAYIDTIKRRARFDNKSKDDRLSFDKFILKKGGISKTEYMMAEVKHALDTQKNQRKYLKDDGLSLDYLREAAVEDGYLREGADLDDVLDLVARSTNGETVYPLDTKPNKAEQERLDRLDFENEISSRLGMNIYTDKVEDIYDAMNAEPSTADAIKQAMEEMDIPFSQIEGVIAGYYDPKELLIKLTQESNPTTFAHEFMHFYVDMLVKAHTSGDITEYWAKQLDKAAKWVGAKKKDGYYKLTPAQKEKLAEGFTTYLKEGKAPHSSLTALFEMFRDLFVKSYRMLRGLKEVKLSKEITDFYDRLFVTDSQATEVAQQERYGAVERPEGESDANWDMYMQLTKKAHATTVSESLSAAARIAEKQSSQEYKDKVKGYYDEFLPQVREDPNFQALDYARQFKINPKSLQGKLPDGMRLNPSYLKEGGDDAQSVMMQGGFSDLAEMVDFLNNNSSSEAKAHELAMERADEWLKEEFPELVKTDVVASSRNLATIKAQLAEAMMLRGISLDQFGLYYQNLVKTAEKTIQGMKLSRVVNIDSLMNQINTLTERYRIAEQKGDKTEMSKLRYRSAVLNYALMRGYAFRKSVKQFDRHFKKYKARPTKENLKSIEGSIWDIISAALYNFNYTSKKPANAESASSRLVAYADEIGKESFAAADMIRDVSLFLDNPEGLKPKDMKVSDFTLINESLRLVEGISKNRVEGWNVTKIQNREDAIQDILAYADEKGIKEWDNDSGIKNFMYGQFTMKETLLSRIFPKKVFVNYVLPFMDGLSKKAIWIDEKGKKLGDIIKPALKDKEKLFNINGRNFKKEHLLVILLNSGNEHNRKCMMKTLQKKYGDFTESDYQAVLDNVPVELRETAQQVWDFFDENIDEFKAVQSRINAAEMKVVEPTPVVFSDGTQLKGGYYPANRKAVSIEKSFTEEMSYKNTEMFPIFGFMKDRTNAAHGDLDMSLRPLETWVYQMGSMINVAEAHDALGSLIRSHRLKARLGDGAMSYLKDWMLQSISPDRTSKTVAFLDSMASVKILGWAPIKAIVQLSGIIPAMAEVGVGYILEETARMMASPMSMLRAVGEAKKLSTYMYERFANPSNHLADVRRMSAIDGGRIKAGLEKMTYIGMYFVAYGDAIASTITWKAQYRKSLASGMTEKQAALEADSLVRRVQGDTSAGSRPAGMQGNLRFLTKFASYFIGINSMIGSSVYVGDRAKAIAILGAAGVFAPAFEALFSSWYDWMSADEKKKRRWRREGITSLDSYMQKKMFKNIGRSTASSLMPAYGLGNMVSNYMMEGKLYTPEINALKFLGESVSISIDAYKHLTAKDMKSREKYSERLMKNTFGLTSLDLEKVNGLTRACDEILRRF